jgi:hypothetical protein
MSAQKVPRKQKLRIIAQDPAVRVAGRILCTQVEVPAEVLGPGPWGHRIQVIDYDASTQTMYQPHEYRAGPGGTADDPYEHADDERLLSDPRFHAQNAYAIVMRILARFEHALGRHVGWSFDGHQIKIVPHAFADANAFYSKQDEGIFFGYFPGTRGQTVFSCLSQDVVAHETCHALLDGLRDRYTDPSSPDQAGFHEGFSDVVALLSVFALPDVVKALLDLRWGSGGSPKKAPSATDRVDEELLTPEALCQSTLLGLAEEMGEEISLVRGQALRRSVQLAKSPKYYRETPAYQEPHRRGEILVAAMLNAFVTVWSERLTELRRDAQQRLDRRRVVEEGAHAADCLLTMTIRAIDYCPPVHIEFGDFLSALLTADYEVRPDDSMYHFRRVIREAFRAYGIECAAPGTPEEPGLWLPPGSQDEPASFTFAGAHFEAMQHDPEEVFRFVWENRQPLDLLEGAFTRVSSVRPCVRLGGDGFLLHETVAEYIQILRVQARELSRFGLKRPADMALDTEVWLYGGGALIFDDYGQLKFHVHNHIDRPRSQNQRLQYLFDHGHFNEGASFLRRFSHVHRLRAMSTTRNPQEGWI